MEVKIIINKINLLWLTVFSFEIYNENILKEKAKLISINLLEISKSPLNIGSIIIYNKNTPTK